MGTRVNYVASDERPAADVYAGDTAGLELPGEAVAYSFRVTADAEPDVLARVANVFTIANAAPASAALCRLSSGSVQIDVALDGLKSATADSICRKLERLTCVLSVVLTPI